LLGSFVSLDDDIEIYLKEKAVEFDKRHICRNYLLLDIRENTPISLMGYFSLAVKNLFFSESISMNKKKKIISGHSSDSHLFILLAQLGKNMSFDNSVKEIENNEEKKSLGSFLLDQALEKKYIKFFNMSTALTGGFLLQK